MPTFTIQALAERIGAEIHGEKDGKISAVAPLVSAQIGELSYLSNSKYQSFLAETKASAVIIAANDIAKCPTTALVVKNPEVAFAKVALLFKKPMRIQSGIHPTAVVGDDCEIAASVSIAAGCVIGARVKIADDTVILAGTIISDDVTIGRQCTLHPRVTLYEGVTLGDRVCIHSGVVIGADGFGLVHDAGKWLPIPQLGSVVIGNDVNIGANTCIDRGALQNTVIEDGVQLDNLIQVGHNVHIGAHTAIAGSVGIAGSATIGKHCMIGGGSCINGHITIVDYVIITGMAMVVKSLTEPGIYSSGTSVLPNKQWLKSVCHFHQLDKLVKRVKQLERLNDE